jgi:hypothetical protein
MKKKIFLLLAAGVSVAVLAQTNSLTTNAPAAKPPAKELGLHADHFYFDGKARQIVYFDNVRGTNEQGELVCARLTFYLPATNSMPTNVVAETNVIINFLNKDGTNHIVCDRAVYDHLDGASETNYTLTFHGHAKMENAKGWMTGEPLVWDNLEQKFSGNDTETHPYLRKGTNDVSNTNASPLDFLK